MSNQDTPRHSDGQPSWPVMALLFCLTVLVFTGQCERWVRKVEASGSRVLIPVVLNTTPFDQRQPLFIHSIDPAVLHLHNDGPVTVTLRGVGFGPGLGMYMDVLGVFDATVDSPTKAHFTISPDVLACSARNPLGQSLVCYGYRGGTSTDYFLVEISDI